MSDIEARVPKRAPRTATPAGRPRSSRPTLRTIAEMTGLAITTISRALSNAPEISAETRARVQRVAAEVGYVPDRTALRLKTGRTHVISLILDPHDEILGFGQSMVSGLTESLRGTAYHLVIAANFRNVSPIEPIRYVLRNRAADGVIFSRTEPDDERVRLLLEHDFPFVSHGRTESPTPHAFVDFDNHGFALYAARRLIQKGARRLAIILPPQRFSFGRHLAAGLAEAVAEAGIAAEVLAEVTLDNAVDDIRLATMRRLAAPEPPDGFICTGDATGLAVMAAIADSGRRIGDGIDVVVKQTSGVFSQVRPKVDAIFEDTALAGRQMGELLLRRIAGAPAEDLQVLHAPRPLF